MLSALLVMAAVWILTITGWRSRRVSVDDAVLPVVLILPTGSPMVVHIRNGHSPLQQIDERNVNQLGLAWSMDFHPYVDMKRLRW